MRPPGSGACSCLHAYLPDSFAKFVTERAAEAVMTQEFYLLKLGPPSGCSPLPWSSIASCIPSLIAIWQRLPKAQQPRLVWAGQGEALIAPPARLEPRNSQLWDLALIVQYPEDLREPGSARVENLGQFVDEFHTEIEDTPADFHTKTASGNMGSADVPTTHSLPGYDRIKKMYQQSPKPGMPVHMINLLHFAPNTGKQHYEQYLEACAPALGAFGAKLAYHGKVFAKVNDQGGKQWDSLLIGAYPDKLALIHGVIHPSYLEAFKMRENALTDAMLLATIPIDLTSYDALVHAKL